MKTAGVPGSSTRERRTGIPARRKDNFVPALMASLMLHALVIMLQFGAPGLGLPWLGLPGEERSARIPTLQAILREPATIAANAEKSALDDSVASAVRAATVPAKKGQIPPPHRTTQLPVEPIVATAGIREAPLRTPPQDAPKLDQLARVEQEPTPAATPEPGTAVLSTDKESQWSMSIAKTAIDDDAKQRDRMLAEERAKEQSKEEEAQQRQKVEELMRLEEESRKTEQAVAVAEVKAREEARERQWAEEQVRLGEEKRQAEQQAAARVREEARERRRAEELARLEEEKRVAEQAAAAKAREETLAKDLVARSLARERREMADRIGAPPVAAAGAASPAAGKPEGGREAGSATAVGSGANLASRALAQAKGGAPVPVPAPVENSPRRGNLLGRDPRDIQLVFYGEGWRQKIERIGSMNYPKLSRNRSYDALVVTVSINSDGTLAGVHIDKSSGYRELDDAVRRIVEMSAPFAAFPPDLKRSYDVVDITRTWSFQDERPRISGQ